MEKLFQSYRLHFKSREFILSLFFGFVMLVIALFVDVYASSYATRSSSNPVTDIILSNIRTFDIDGLFVYGPLVFWFFIVIPPARPNP